MAEYWELMESTLGWEPRELFPLRHDFGQISFTCKMRGLAYVLSSSQILTRMMPFSSGIYIYSFTECLLCAIQQSHPLSSPPAFTLSQHQGLFQWVGSSHQVAKVLEFQLQSFQWIFRVDWHLSHTGQTKAVSLNLGFHLNHCRIM